MKNQKLFALMLAFFSFTIQTVVSQPEAWNRIQPLPQEHALNCVRQIPGTGTVVAAGDGSTIMYSDDDGESWDITLNPAGLPNQSQFLVVNFFDGQHGFAAANYGTIIRTTDGGSNWEVVYRANEDSLETARVDIHLFDAETAVVVGYDRLILRTEDGGENWTTLLSPRGFLPSSVDFIDGHTGFIVGSADTAILLKTIDGGLHWEPQAVRVDNMQTSHDVHFINDYEGFISGFFSRGTYILKTDDAGDSWQTVYFTDEPREMGEIDFKDEVHGAARIYSWGSSFLYSDDGGDTWYLDQNSFFYNYSPCYSFFYAPELMIGVGRFGLIGRSFNSGNTWEDMTEKIHYNRCLNAQFTSEQTGYMMYTSRGGGAADGSLLKTTDGGQNWFTVFEYTPNGSFDFLNDNTGFVIRHTLDMASLFKTSNGGETWNWLFDFVNDQWDYDITINLTFLDSLHGIASFKESVYITDDGGVNWQNILQLNYRDEIHSIFYDGVDTFFMAAELHSHAAVLKSFDGGTTFETDTLDDSYSFAKKIYFLNQTTGFCLTNRDVYKTTDMGNTWVPATINDSTFAFFSDVCFPTGDIGYASATGDYTTLFKTLDAGETWDPINVPSTSGLSHLYFYDEWHGFVFGDNGVIMETFTGGIVGTPENHLVAAEPFFTVSPNPTANNILIAMDKAEVDNVWVEIINLNGAFVYRNRFSGTSAHNDVSISLQDFPSGIYVCRVMNGNKLSSRKIVKL